MSLPVPRFRRFLLIAAVIAGLAVLFHLINVHGLEPIRAQVERLGFWAPFGILFLRGVSIILPALPAYTQALNVGDVYKNKISETAGACMGTFKVPRTT